MTTSSVPPKLHDVCRRLRNNDEKLNELDLGGLNVGNSGALALGEALLSNTELNLLNLSYNLIPSSGSVILMSGARSVETLDLRYNSIGDDGAAAIGNALFDDRSKLKKIWLRNNYIGIQGGISLLASLWKNKTLRHLDLGTNHIGNQGAEAVANALQHNTTLEWMGLWNNDIDSQGIAVIAESLKTNKTLKVLHLGGNNISDEGAFAVADAIQQNNTLTSLHMANGRIKQNGADAIAKALRSNSTMLVVDLLHNPIGLPGALAFRDTLELYNWTLRELLVDYHSQTNTLMGLQVDYHKGVNAQITVYLKLNQAGRSSMMDIHIPWGSWSTVLQKISKDPDLIYLTILERPDLCQR